VPVALFNLVGLLGTLEQTDSWVRHWWQPAAAVAPAVAEQTWASLFLVPLTYAVLRAGSHRPALVAAVVVSALVHGFAHSGVDPVGIVVGSLLFSVPAALLFVRRDLETAVGYHVGVDLVRFVTAYLLITQP
jgi:hypothetical protein